MGHDASESVSEKLAETADGLSEEYPASDNPEQEQVSTAVYHTYTKNSEPVDSTYFEDALFISDLEKNSNLWYVSMDGLVVDARTLPIEVQIYCAERGLIPYVPALKDKK